jgi:murein L,D-transpeptidase YcbB/YkuD
MTLFLLGPMAVAANGSRAWDGFEQQVWLATIAHVNRARAETTDNDLPGTIERLYRLAGYRPLWVSATGLNAQGTVLLKALRNAHAEGLDPNDYLNPSWLMDGVDPVILTGTIYPSDLKQRIQMDVMLTDALIRYASHLSRGRLTRHAFTPPKRTDHVRDIKDLTGELATAVKAGRLIAGLDNLQPQQNAYQRLKSALRQYEQVQIVGGWPVIPPGPSLRRGDQGLRVSVLRRRLFLSGDLLRMPPLGIDRYDRPLEAAVMRFQYRHGLEPDGIVGPRTLAALSVSVNARITQLRLNMERWRWYPDRFGERYLLVNIPDYTLRVVEHGRTVHRMRAIVGKPDRQTPTLYGRMTYLTVNPYWNIPRKIARQDILPKIIHDPGYLVRQGIQVFERWEAEAPALDPLTIPWDQLAGTRFPYRLRQEPSVHNALGRVKFMFPNRNSIYIHDTPSTALFDRPQRAYSSGCVRVEDPLRLAQYLLQDLNWDRFRLEAAIATGRERSIVLNRSIPVFLVYFTGWVDEFGRIHFREDVYGKDRDLDLAIRRRSAPLLFSDCKRETGRLMADFRPHNG